MALQVERVGYGRPAAERLRTAIAAAKGGEPLGPVTVVVPSNHVGVAARRLLASGTLGPTAGRGSGIAAVTFLTVYRLAELLGAARLAGQGRRPVSTPVIAAALRASLAAEPGIFGPVADHPATETALVAAYKELRDLTPGALDRVASTSQRASDVVRLHRSARARVEPAFSDEEDLMTTAIAVLEEDAVPERELDALVVYLPQRLSRHGAALLAAVAARTDVTVLAGTTGDPAADADVRRSVSRLGVDEARWSSAATAAPGQTVSVDRTRIVTTSDADEEVRAAVRTIVDAARSGTPLERIAVLYGSAQPYARTVHEQLELAGIAHNGSAVLPLTARMAGRALLGMLALPEAGFRREDLFAWLAGGRFHVRGRMVPVTAWERLSRDAGVVSGRQHWDALLAAHARDCDAEAERTAADPDAPEWRAERWRQDAGRARDLRHFVLALIDELSAAADRPRAWADHVAWARRRLDELLGPDRSRARWPRVEQAAEERTARALDRLACLDAVEGPVGLDVFARTLALELEADLGRVGRMGEGVLVGSVRMGVGLDLDLVIVLGLAEGVFPTLVRDDSLLPDREREAAVGELGLRGEETERQHHELLASLAGATRQVLCVPRGDLRRSNETVPSRWVADVASALAGRRLGAGDLGGADGSWLEHVASYDAGLRRAAFPATQQEHRLRALLSDSALHSERAARGVGHLGKIVEDAVLGAGAELVAGRRSRRFTRFDGNLAGVPVPTPAGGTTSATRLEGWAACPFAYFVKEILRVEPVERPEDRLRISPLDLGSLVHEVLEQFIADVLAGPADAQPRPDQPWDEEDRQRMRKIATEVCDRYEAHGLVGRPIFWRRDRRRTVAELARFLDEDSGRRAAHRTRPVAAELAFGMGGAGPGPVPLGLPDGRTVAFRGKADRLDVADDGTLEVVDYKTGRSTSYAGLDETDPDGGGRRLQLTIYALAARLFRGLPDAPVRSEYWFTSFRGQFKRVGYDVTPAVLERVAATVHTMVTGMETGVFPQYPVATSTTPFVVCEYCDPDGLGVVDLRRQADRKRGDPALSVFYDLVERIGDDAGRFEGEALGEARTGAEEVDGA